MVVAKLIQAKFKVETLNLKSNGVGDESARRLLAAVKANPHIKSIKLDMNPAASSVIVQIEQALEENQKAGPTADTFVEDIQNVIEKMTDSLLDCAFEPKVLDKMCEYLPLESQKTLKELTKGGAS